MRAAVVAGIAGGAVAIPFWPSALHPDILQRAYLGAESAACASLCNIKLSVCNQKGIEERADNIALKKGVAAHSHSGAGEPLRYALRYMRQLCLSGLNFGFGTLRAIQLHWLKVYVGLRHLQAEGGIQAQVQLAQCLAEYSL